MTFKNLASSICKVPDRGGMQLVKTLKFRIKDSSKKKLLEKMAVAVNFVWNYCNETSFNAIRKDHKWLSGFDLQKLTAGTSKELGVCSQTITSVCEEYATRRKQFKKRKLRWRSKRSLGWIPFKEQSIQIKNGNIIYRKQVFRVWQSERLPAKGEYGAGSFNQDAKGNWYFCVSVKYESTPTMVTADVGIDPGLKTLATLSDGTKVSHGKNYQRLESKLAMAQRAKKKRLVKAIHAKIKNKRRDDLHKASAKIAKSYKTIYIGDVSHKFLASGNKAKSAQDASLYMFKEMLKYKAITHEHKTLEVNEANTTRTCSNCKTIPVSSPKGQKGLEVREWVCCNCGSIHDRDVNAALNILRIGRDTLRSKGTQETSSVDEVDDTARPS